MLIKHAAKLEKSATVDALWAGAVDVFASIGLNQAIYLSVDSEFENLFARSTMTDLYNERRPNEDPFLIHACRRYAILTVGTEFLDEHPYVSVEEREFIKRGAENGLRAGLALPMRLRGSERFGGFVVGNTLSKTQFLKRMLPLAEDIRMFCMILHRRIEELIAATPDTPKKRRPLVHNALPEGFDLLTPREIEVLTLLAQGQTRKAAAHICDISIHTVSDYAKSSYKKLGVRNRAEVATLLYGPSQVKRAGR